MSLSWRERVTALGFGVSGPHGTPLVTRAATIALIEQAAALGVGVFDTAPAYGAGEAERRLGAALPRIGRERVVVSTKAGLMSHGLAARRRDVSPAGVEASLRASLDRLGVEGVDVLFLHGPAPHELSPALFKTLNDLRAAGAFAALGAAGRGAELDAVIDSDRFDAVMAPVHPFLDPPEIARLARARAAGLCVFAIETAGDAAPSMRLPRRPADLYALAKRWRRRGRGRGRVSVEQGLAAALSRSQAACALTTTTRLEHLRTSVRTVLDGR